MPFYKDNQNKVYWLDDAKDEGLLPAGVEQITDDEAESLRNPPETPEQTIARLEKALDNHLDAVANSYRYESIRTMVTYATSEHPTFGPEGRAAVKFRDAVYAFGIQKIADCTREVGPEPIPTEEELLAELPNFADYIEEM